METSSRPRLVAASQALELEHLQSLIRSRDIQSQRTEENLLALLRESRSENDRLIKENRELKQNLEDFHSEKNAHANSDKDTICFLRSRISSLEEEREVLLDKIVVEKKNYFRARGQRDSYSQTTDLGGIHADSIDEIRCFLSLEQSLKSAAENEAAVRATNIATLQDQLQRRIETEVLRLQSEQEAYAHMLFEIHPKRESLLDKSKVSSLQVANSRPLHQQEDEMLNLRRRLNDLQGRHQRSELGEIQVAGMLQHSSVLQRMLQSASKAGR
ncbi:Hypothetical protein, putative [Bodo saltans]|uniref:Uncharacterized protein n=1 Tax=Bodo saltans TaxID=75058 RepID=A0A0S4J0C8_BODSA|nr:Hypothetical protein, putative [Bodo saltans]|eukprot:CUF97005.1 Hypothetical protein, putative [Bodo saltans]